MKRLGNLDYNIGKAAKLEVMGPVKFIGLVLLICFAAFAVSYYISIRIMEKKEF